MVKYPGLTELSAAIERLERGTAAPGDRLSDYVNELGERIARLEEQTPPTAEVSETVKQLARRVADLEDGRTGDDVRHFVGTLGARVAELEQRAFRAGALPEQSSESGNGGGE